MTTGTLKKRVRIVPGKLDAYKHIGAGIPPRTLYSQPKDINVFCMCTWVMSPFTQPYMTLKYMNTLCPIRHFRTVDYQ